MNLEMSVIKKFDSNIKMFNVLTLVSLILFFLIALLWAFILFMAFLRYDPSYINNFRYNSFYFFITFSTGAAWAGIGLIIISNRKIKNDYVHIVPSQKKYMIGTGLIIISFGMFIIFNAFFVRNPINSFTVSVSIISIVSILGFLISWFLLKKAKLIFTENPELILESKEVEETEKLKTLYCPRCRHKIEGDVTSCALCDLNFTESPPMAYSQISRLRYCPRCQKNVQKKRKFGVVFWIAFVLLIIFVFTFVGGIGIIAIIGLLIVTAVSSPRCSNCKKKTQPPQFTTQQTASNPQVQ